MIQEIDPTQTKRAAAFSLWMHAPMPMITLFKTLDVTPLVRYSHRTGCKFHMLLCWCIGRAASQTEAFYLLPVDQKLIQYDKLAISTVVPTADHAISTCDIPFSTDLSQFQQDYLNLTRRVHDTGEAYNLAEEYMVIGTSALSQYDIDGAVNLYAGFYNNPFLIWGNVKAGLTGYAQVYGKYNTTPYDKLKLDMLYIENYSFWLDIKILLMTFKVILQKENSEGIDENQITALKREIESKTTTKY